MVAEPLHGCANGMNVYETRNVPDADEAELNVPLIVAVDAAAIPTDSLNEPLVMVPPALNVVVSVLEHPPTEKPYDIVVIRLPLTVKLNGRPWLVAPVQAPSNEVPGGAGGTGADTLTTTVTSLETPLVPHEFLARSRTKNVPLPAVAVYVVAVLARSRLARFDEPGDEPASTRYVAGEPDAAFQVILTELPVTVAVRPLGADGAAVQPGVLPPTTTTTSFETELTPLLFVARTRT